MEGKLNSNSFSSAPGTPWPAGAIHTVEPAWLRALSCSLLSTPCTSGALQGGRALGEWTPDTE